MPRKKNSKRGRKGGVATATRQGMSPMAAGVMGAVAGAAVGATAAVILTDENTRKKIGEVVDNISKQTPEMAEKAKQKAHDVRGKAADVMDNAQKQLRESTPTQGTKSSQREEKI